MPRPVRVLLLADSHLGFDLPRRPRIERRRRGLDFARNYALALEPARERAVDLVVHGGDLFFRSEIPASLVWDGFAPLVEVARAGVPVFVVPGNHERGSIPHPLLSRHRLIHIFDAPKKFIIDIRGIPVGLFGFPYFSKQVRRSFPQLLTQTGLARDPSSIRLLCMHQLVEGATVGPQNYRFTTAPDVIRAADLPHGVGAVLSGHIHRAQHIEYDTRGAPLNAPVIYPGSIERTSFAEKDETKGYYLLEFEPDKTCGGRLVRSHFVPLPARPMVDLTVDSQGITAGQLCRNVQTALAGLDPHSIVRLRLNAESTDRTTGGLSAATLRALAPRTMNVEVGR